MITMHPVTLRPVTPREASFYGHQAGIAIGLARMDLFLSRIEDENCKSHFEMVELHQELHKQPVDLAGVHPPHDGLPLCSSLLGQQLLLSSSSCENALWVACPPASLST